jgi:hypothetical protein
MDAELTGGDKMKVGELNFDVQYVGSIIMRDIDCTTEEFKALLEAVKELEKMEVEKQKISSEAMETINLPPKPEVKKDE